MDYVDSLRHHGIRNSSTTRTHGMGSPQSRRKTVAITVGVLPTVGSLVGEHLHGALAGTVETVRRAVSTPNWRGRPRPAGPPPRPPHPQISGQQSVVSGQRPPHPRPLSPRGARGELGQVSGLFPERGEGRANWNLVPLPPKGRGESGVNWLPLICQGWVHGRV